MIRTRDNKLAKFVMAFIRKERLMAVKGEEGGRVTTSEERVL